ncbi:MAG TPA: ROK family glucokinase [Candidatus Aerophobetes bacterium]|uniref:Glucokinase n=1 Tax=Aerophobetes bacterium TaxID=2030807 RepID=A0A7V5HZF5_UNCAE|nr:ROK family glucokinase [Candidatus Aerophobetes bacterium]
MAKKKSSFAIGIDVGGTNIKSLLVDREGKVLASDTRRSFGKESKEKEKVLSQLFLSIKALKEEGEKKGVSSHQIAGVGIGAPGPLNTEEGIIYQAPNIPSWKNIPIVKIVEERIKIPCFLENDANAAALGEWWLGAGRGFDYILLLTLGTGIGGGVIIKGEVYRGARGCGAEIGHMIIKEGGITCGCGARGCFEAYASATGVVKRAKALVDKGYKTLLSEKEELACEDVFEAAKKKDEIALFVVEETCRYLGIGIGNLLNIFNPEIVILSGGMAKEEKILLPLVKKYTKLFSLKSCFEKVKIVRAKLKDRAGAFGACATVLKKEGMI